VNQLEPSRPIGANFPLSLLAATKLVGVVGIEETSQILSLIVRWRFGRSCQQLLIALI
jgi:hypothetical protein